MPKKKHRPRKPAQRRPGHRPRPAGGSLGANVIDYAIEEGVDVTDPIELAAFMDRYNAMPHEVRVWISDGAWRDADDDEDDDVVLPAFLEQLPDEATMEAYLANVDEHALFVDAPLMRRADMVMRTIGSGHPFTPDDGLGAAAVDALLEEFGYTDMHDRASWDMSPVSALLAGLAGGGFLQLDGDRLLPAAGVAPWAGPEDAAEQRIVAGRILYATTLRAFFEEQDGISAALAAPLTAMSLMSAVAPGGLHLPEITDEPDGFEELRLAVRTDLLALEDIGVVTREGDTFFAPPVLVSVLPAVIEDMESELG